MIFPSIFTRTWSQLWPPSVTALIGAAACIASWKGFILLQIHRWEESDPVIHVYGSPAVVASTISICPFDMGGKTINEVVETCSSFVKENGKWLAIADQFSPYPA